MNKKSFIDTLNFSEMSLLLGHLKLGISHLKKQLTPEEYKELLSAGTLNPNQKNNIVDNFFEKLSQFIPALNTILTSVFGGFLGFSAMTGFDLSIPSRLCGICFFALCLGAFMGYLCNKKTYQEAKLAIDTLKIYKLQLRLLQQINQYLERSYQDILNQIKFAFRSLTEHSENFNFEDEKETSLKVEGIITSIKQKTREMPNEPIYLFYRSYIWKELEQLKKSFSLEKQSIQHPLTPTSHENQFSFLKRLTDPNFILASPSKQETWWVKKNWVSLAFDLIPTIFGSFASLFVFMNGIPQIARLLGIFQIESFFVHHKARIVQLILMVMITSYYALSFIYSRKKAIKRRKELDDIQREILNQETEMMNLNYKIGKMNQSYHQLKVIKQALEIPQKIEENFS